MFSAASAWECVCVCGTHQTVAAAAPAPAVPSRCVLPGETLGEHLFPRDRRPFHEVSCFYSFGWKEDRARQSAPQWNRILS